MTPEPHHIENAGPWARYAWHIRMSEEYATEARYSLVNSLMTAILAITFVVIQFTLTYGWNEIRYGLEIPFILFQCFMVGAFFWQAARSVYQSRASRNHADAALEAIKL